jgi:hypothetical protein
VATKSDAAVVETQQPPALMTPSSTIAKLLFKDFQSSDKSTVGSALAVMRSLLPDHSDDIVSEIEARVNVSIFVDLGGYPLTKLLMEKWIDEPLLQASALLMLTDALYLDQAISTRPFIELGMMELIFSVMEKYPAEENVFVVGWIALHYMVCGLDENSTHLFDKLGGIEKTVATMSEYKTFKRVQVPCILVLEKVASMRSTASLVSWPEAFNFWEKPYRAFRTTRICKTLHAGLLQILLLPSSSRKLRLWSQSSWHGS